MPIIDEHEPPFSERPFRTQATNAPRGNGRERHFSSMLWRQSKLERFLSSILHFRGGSKGISRAFCGSRADSSGTCPALFSFGARSSGHFEPAVALDQARAPIARANCCSGPSSSGHFEPSTASGHFEPAAALGQARAVISSHLRLRASLQVGSVRRCGVFEPGRAEHESPSPPKTRSAETRRKLQ